MRPCLCTISGEDHYIMRVENFNYVYPNPVIKMAMIKMRTATHTHAQGQKKFKENYHKSESPMDNILPGIIIDGVLGNLIAIPVFKSQYDPKIYDEV